MIQKGNTLVDAASQKAHKSSYRVKETVRHVTGNETGDSMEIPENLQPFVSALTLEQTIEQQKPSFKRQQRELFDMAIMLEGFIQKKTDSLINRFQKKYFQVIANGAYLVYFDKQPNHMRIELEYLRAKDMKEQKDAE